jgi:hypothetical protein
MLFTRWGFFFLALRVFTGHIPFSHVAVQKTGYFRSVKECIFLFNLSLSRVADISLVLLVTYNIILCILSVQRWFFVRFSFPCALSCSWRMLCYAQWNEVGDRFCITLGCDVVES